jgi:hypothetical protein
VRKLLVGIVMTSLVLALAGPTADAAGGLSGTSQHVRGEKVKYTATTSCRRVYLRSDPGGPHTAIYPQTKTVHGGSVTFVRVVRSGVDLRKVSSKKFTIRARCNNRKGRTIGTVRLTVKRRLAFTGLPVLPQALLAVGLLGTGGLLLLLGRRRRSGQAGGRARRRFGAAGGRWA